jgi:hypothetical protein
MAGAASTSKATGCSYLLLRPRVPIIVDAVIGSFVLLSFRFRVKGRRDCSRGHHDERGAPSLRFCVLTRERRAEIETLHQLQPEHVTERVVVSIGLQCRKSRAYSATSSLCLCISRPSMLRMGSSLSMGSSTVAVIALTVTSASPKPASYGLSHHG